MLIDQLPEKGKHFAFDYARLGKHFAAAVHVPEFLQLLGDVPLGRHRCVVQRRANSC